MPREKHFENIAQVDINLVPLELGNSFCEAKSELKFIEAGVVGVPTIASATGTYQYAIKNGIDGYVAQNNQEWEKYLQELIDDSELRKKMGQNAKKKVIDHYTNKNSHNEEYYNFLKSKLQREEGLNSTNK